MITLNTKFIIIPYNINKNHWCLVICDIAANKLLYFDSIHDFDGNRSATLLCRNINDWLSKLSAFNDLNNNEFTVDDMSLKINYFPSQGNNTTECGVFVMMFADYYMNGLPLDFTLRDMLTFRKKIFLALSRGTLNYSNTFYPITDFHKNKHIIKFQSSSPNSYDTLSLSICRELIDNFILFDKDYVIVSNVINPITKISAFIKNFGDYELINFDTASSKREQSTTIFDKTQLNTELKILTDSLNMFFDVLSSNESSTSKFNISYKLLKSLPNCKSQALHCDSNCKDSLYDIQYSLIIAIEKNTQFILSNSKKITIPINGMIMFRGDYQHAGASYIKSNHRIFASCSNHPLNKNFVFPVEVESN